MQHFIHFIAEPNCERFLSRHLAVADKPWSRVVQHTMARVWPPETRPSHLWPRRIWSFYVKGCKHRDGVPLGQGRAWRSSLRGYHTECDRCWSNGKSVYVRRSAGKSACPIPSRLSWSVKVIGTEWHGSIGYLWLPINVP